MKLVLLALFLFLSSALALGQMMPPPPRDPITVKSPSGNASLWIDPSTPYPPCSALYRLTLNGKVAWKATLPFTLDHAIVSDAGVVGGDFNELPRARYGPLNLTVAIIDAHGSVVLKDILPFAKSQVVDGPSDPNVDGVVLDAINNYMIVRVDHPFAQPGSEDWRIYQLSPAAQLKMGKPTANDSTSRAISIDEVSSVAGTPLLLVNWNVARGSQYGQSFTLNDEMGRSLWHYDVESDFETPSADGSNTALDEALRQGTILRSDQPSSFEVRFVRQAQRVTFEVVRDGDNWAVRELSRRSYAEPKPEAVHPLKATRVDLAFDHGFTVARTAKVNGSIRKVSQFDFWGPNRLVFLRREIPTSICVVDLHGKLIRHIVVPKSAVGPSKDSFLAKVSGSHFVLVANDGLGNGAHAWKLDVATGKFTALPKFDEYPVKAVAAFPSGKFAVLSTQSVPYSLIEHLSYHGSDGKRIWIAGENGWSGGDEEIFSPEDVSIDSEGHIAVLENIENAIQLFDQDGKLKSIIKLDKVWGRKAQYPTHLTCAPDGGFWLYDFSSDKPLMHLAKTGKILSDSKPYFPSGLRFDLREPVRLSPDGSPWVTDGKSIVRLNRSGLAVQPVGTWLDDSGLGSLAGVKVGPRGTVYAVEEDTSAVHVFDTSGKERFAVRLKPKEIEFSTAVVMSVGDIFILSNKGWVRFSASGKRVGVVQFDPSDVADTGWGQSGNMPVNESSDSAAPVRRWPDRAWLRTSPVVAPNGRMMAFQQAERGKPVPAFLKLAFYDPSGKPESQTKLPPGMPEISWAAFDGTTSYLVTKAGLIAMNRQGKAVWVYKPKGWNDGWEVFNSLGKIALFDGERTVIWVDPNRLSSIK